MRLLAFVAPDVLWLALSRGLQPSLSLRARSGPARPSRERRHPSETKPARGMSSSLRRSSAELDLETQRIWDSQGRDHFRQEPRRQAGPRVAAARAELEALGRGRRSCGSTSVPGPKSVLCRHRGRAVPQADGGGPRAGALLAETVAEKVARRRLPIEGTPGRPVSSMAPRRGRAGAAGVRLARADLVPSLVRHTACARNLRRRSPGHEAPRCTARRRRSPPRRT